MDGATAEVIRTFLNAAADEMRTTLMRTSFNPVIYEARDFGISIFDAQLELIAEAPGVTMFLGANDFSIRKGIEFVGRDSLNPGDVFLLNYPYWNAAHTYDATIFAPLFVDGSIAAFLCIRAHWKDLGAKDAGYVVDSTNVHQEGLLFPGTRVVDRGTLVSEILDLIRFNSRLPDSVIGDLHAQIAAIRTGERRLLELYARYGRETMDAAMTLILSHGESVVRRALEGFPEGRWHAVDWLDNDVIGEQPVRMQATITFSREAMSIDFAGSSGAVIGPVNMPFGTTIAVSRVFFKAITSPFERTNGGHFRALEVKAEPGSLFHATYPSATFMQRSCFGALELLFKALASADPERGSASSGGDVPGYMMVGSDPATGSHFALGNNDAVGWGATSSHDGADSLLHPAQSVVRTIPIEVVESESPVLVERLEMRPDSCGPGRFRGGLGVRRDLRFLGSGEFLTVTLKTKFPPWGLLAGGEAQPTQCIFFPDTDGEVHVSTTRVEVNVGDRFRILTSGGGGFGDPATRDPSAILADIEEGFISVSHARDAYGLDTENPADHG